VNPIPVLGTALINEPYWVYRLFYSIDYPVDDFVVWNNNGRGQITEELDHLKNLPHRFVKRVHICHLPHNLGCSGAWNLTIKSFMMAPYWAITNHDVMYEPGFLEAVAEKMEDPDLGICHGNNGGWDFFAIKDWMIEKYGLFDEALVPAYVEDLEYGSRFMHTEDNNKRCLGVEPGYYHGALKDSYDDGSQSWRSEPELAQKIHLSHELNKQYVTQKWGPGWQSHVEEPTYSTPFNERLPQTFTTYPLHFVRQKNLGF
jgi:hypothetical protein